jgi:hypothetical protein
VVSAGSGLILGILRPQIKTRARVRDLAEVYTHEREVNAMLDLVPDMFPSDANPGNHDRTFLEPACGSGNFLEEILLRKLATVTTRRYGRGERYEHRVLRCLASIYGVDIDYENVIDSRERLRAVIASHLDRDMNTVAPTEGLASAVEAILETNVVVGDSLNEPNKIPLVRYQPTKVGFFLREWSYMEEGEDQGQGHLFGIGSIEHRHDREEIHYSLLAQHPDPYPGVLPP